MINKQSVVLATGHPAINEEIKKFQDITVCGEVSEFNLLQKTTIQLHPDIILVSIFLHPHHAEMIDTILNIRKQSPKTRVIYLAGNLDAANPEHRAWVGMLADAQVFDIHTLGRVDMKIIGRYIFTPSTIKALEGWVNIEPQPSSLIQTSTLIGAQRASEPAPISPPSHQSTAQAKTEVRPPKTSNPSVIPGFGKNVTSFISEEEARVLAGGVMQQISDNDKEGGYYLPKLFVVSSVKPGTGKSFLSTNLAAAIAQFGRLGPEGRKPRVAIIEGDLQNLSIGTILDVEEDQFNLKTAIEKIDTIIDARTGALKDGVEPYQIDEVDQFIKKCFKEYSHVKNLHALVGSQFQPDELGLVTGYHYTYLIETIHSMFDVVIVDTNSSLNHVTTYPLLMLANQIYYVLNLDYNNIHNNWRYRTKLVGLGIGDKIKYILNEDISQNKDNKEKLIFGPNELKESGFHVCGSVPAIDKAVFLNRLHAAIPIVLDEEKITLKARLEIERIAQDIWPMDNIVLLESEYKKYEANQLKSAKSNGKKGLLGLFRR